jgi:hypothetical protein
MLKAQMSEKVLSIHSDISGSFKPPISACGMRPAAAAASEAPKRERV